jgi:hypothetical protein
VSSVIVLKNKKSREEMHQVQLRGTVVLLSLSTGCELEL